MAYLVDGVSTLAKGQYPSLLMCTFPGLTVADKRILTLGVASTVFEGTMYLFVVFWSPAMIAARKTANLSATQDPPFGLIFASFMAAMMLGSQIFAGFMQRPSPQLLLEPEESTVITLHRSSFLLKMLLPLASICLSWSVFSHTEASTLWAFCLYEMSIGAYFPSMGVLKGLLVEDAHRASVYALLRVPLNCFVVAGLALTREGS